MAFRRDVVEAAIAQVTKNIGALSTKLKATLKDEKAFNKNAQWRMLQADLKKFRKRLTANDNKLKLDQTVLAAKAERAAAPKAEKAPKDNKPKVKKAPRPPRGG